MNNYKKYKKILECKGVGTMRSAKTDNTTSSPQTTRISGSSLISSLRQSQSSQSGIASNLMTIQEFLLTASSETHPSRDSAYSTSAAWSTSDGFTGPRLFESSQRRRNSNYSSQRETPRVPSTSKDDIQKEIIEYTDHDFDVGNKPSNDVWEHVCSDKLWVNVLEYYYSLCTTSKERREKCFQLKGVDIIHTPMNELADTLLFKAKSKKTESSKRACTKRKSEECVPTDEVEPSTDLKCNENSEVMQILNELVDKVVDLSECLDQKPSTNKEAISNTKKDKLARKRDASSTRNKPCKIKRFVDIDTDNKTSKKLSTVGDCKWTRKNDLDLITYMISLRKNGDSETVVCVYFVQGVFSILLLYYKNS